MEKVEGVNVRKEKKKKKSFCLKITPCDFLAHHPLIILLEKNNLKIVIYMIIITAQVTNKHVLQI